MRNFYIACIASSLMGCGTMGVFPKQSAEDKDPNPTWSSAEPLIVDEFKNASLWDGEVTNRCTGVRKYVDAFMAQHAPGIEAEVACEVNLSGSYKIEIHFDNGGNNLPLIKGLAANFDSPEGNFYACVENDGSAESDCSPSSTYPLLYAKAPNLIRLPATMNRFATIPAKNQTLYGHPLPEAYKKLYEKNRNLVRTLREVSFEFTLSEMMDDFSGVAILSNISVPEGSESLETSVFGCDTKKCLQDKQWHFRFTEGGLIVSCYDNQAPFETDVTYSTIWSYSELL